MWDMSLDSEDKTPILWDTILLKWTNDNGCVWTCGPQNGDVVSMMAESIGIGGTPVTKRYLVAGLEQFFIFPYVGNNNPNWRTHIFQRGWNHQPDI